MRFGVALMGHNFPIGQFWPFLVNRELQIIDKRGSSSIFGHKEAANSGLYLSESKSLQVLRVTSIVIVFAHYCQYFPTSHPKLTSVSILPQFRLF